MQISALFGGDYNMQVNEIPHSTQNGIYRTMIIKSSTHALCPRMGFHRPIRQRLDQISVGFREQETFTIRTTILSWPPSENWIAGAFQGR